MDSNPQTAEKFELPFVDAQMEDHLNGSYHGGLSETDLNFPPADLNTFCGHTVDINGFDGKILQGEDSNTGFLLEPPSNLKDECLNESVTSSSPSLHLHNFIKQYPDDIVSQVDTLEVPPRVCMGCKRCYMYIVVSKSDAKCPKCNSIDLLDVSSFKPPMKKARKD